MTISATSQGLRPGVCTSSNRPANPFTGMLIFETDTNRLAVYNGSAWVVLADADTPPGLELVKTQTSFSASSSVTADNIFTSNYTSYRLLVRYQTSSTGNILLRLRTGGSSAATNYNIQYIYFQNTSVAAARLTGRTSLDIGINTNGAYDSLAILDIVSPNVATPTLFNLNNSYNTGAYTSSEYYLQGGNHSTATAYDGIELFPSTGTMTGHYTVYGYRNS